MNRKVKLNEKLPLINYVEEKTLKQVFVNGMRDKNSSLSSPLFLLLFQFSSSLIINFYIEMDIFVVQ